MRPGFLTPVEEVEVAARGGAAGGLLQDDGEDEAVVDFGVDGDFVGWRCTGRGFLGWSARVGSRWHRIVWIVGMFMVNLVDGHVSGTAEAGENGMMFHL
jgi:hypothetical protein